MTDEQFSQVVFFLSVAGGIGCGTAFGIGMIVFGIITLMDKNDKRNALWGSFAIIFGIVAILIAAFSFFTFRNMIIRGRV